MTRSTTLRVAKMKFVFLMDPLESVIFEKDTTFALMLGAQARGHEVFYLPKGGISLQNGQLLLKTTRVIPQRNKARPFIVKRTATLSGSDIDALFIRTDPPFDEEYLMHTWLLDHLPEHVVAINRPEGIRRVNEKIWAARFKGLVPPTLVSRDRGELLKFIEEQGRVVAKPANGYGGKSVFKFSKADLNKNVILETLTDNFRQEVIVQKYLPAAQKGDKRILLLNGEPLGAVLRVHGKDDHRNNFFAGGKPRPADINDRDRLVIKTLKPYLCHLGLYFVGIDMLGGSLIEVNVTSPTCLQEMNRLYQKNLELEVIRFVEKSVAEKQFSASLRT